jgi:glycosyltransferase involved in cell wall biosynthesis
MNMPKLSISVIIPVYNTEKYLAQAIKSVLDQTVQPDEIIVVDDGSTDKSVEVARQFLPKVKIITQQNKGAGTARNVGIKEASGAYLAFLDADDLWVENKLEQQLSYLENHPETDMVFGIVAQFVSPELSAEHQSKLKTELEKMPGYVAGAMLIKLETFMKVGLLNEKLELGEFIDWFSRAKDMSLSYHVLDEVVLKRRIHTTNMGIYKKQNLKDYTSILREALARKRKMMNSNEE